LPKTTTRARGKTNLRRPAVKQRRNPPIMPLAVGGVFLVVLIGLVIWYRFASGTGSGSSGQAVANVHCDSGEQLAVHYHAHLDILYRNQPVSLPAQVGIPGSCFYWLHTHDTGGVIHVEAPKDSASRQFTLGDFFSVWGQPLSSTQVATLKAAPGEEVRAWVNGQPYIGNPSKIVLKAHEQIVLEIGPPYTDPPPEYTFDPSL
jgi:hypothetical protein